MSMRAERERQQALLHVIRRGMASPEVMALLELCDTMVQETAQKLVAAELAAVPALQGEAKAYQTLARKIRQSDFGQE